MKQLIIRLKSGFQIPVKCKSFTIERDSITGEMRSFDINGAESYFENTIPVFVRLGDIECVIEQTYGGNR